MNLIVGEFIDVCDRQEEWHAAQIVRIDANDDVLVRFPGWPRADDELLQASELASQTAPLYQHSDNRDEWKAGDKVDYLCCKANVWVQVDVVDVDSSNGTVTVELPRRVVARAYKIHRSPESLDDVLVRRISNVNILGDCIAPHRTHTSFSDLTEDNFRALFERRSAPAHPRAAPTVSVASRTHVPVPRQQKRKRDVDQESNGSQQPSSTTWLAPLLRARHVSDAHILLCEQKLIDEEGFATRALFVAFSDSLAPYLTSIGITGRGLQLNLAELHQSLQAGASPSRR